jgi:hypothetical protein
LGAFDDVIAVIDTDTVKRRRDHRQQYLDLRELVTGGGDGVFLPGQSVDDGHLSIFDNPVGNFFTNLKATPLHGFLLEYLYF